mgnify:CR=1 FL=1
MTSMTQRYGDHRSKAEALKMMLADVMMETGLIHSYSRLDNNNTNNNNNNNKDDEGYMGRLKRSVLSESWAAVDYDSRHHHAYCEVSIFTTIYYLLSTTAPTTHIHIYAINGVVSILLSAAAGSDRQISRGGGGGGRAALPGVYVPREEPSTQAPL